MNPVGQSTHDRTAECAVFASAADEAALVRVTEVRAVPDGIAASAAWYTQSRLLRGRRSGRSSPTRRRRRRRLSVWALVRALSPLHPAVAHHRPPGTLCRHRRPAPRSRTSTGLQRTLSSLCSSKCTGAWVVPLELRGNPTLERSSCVAASRHRGRGFTRMGMFFSTLPCELDCPHSALPTGPAKRWLHVGCAELQNCAELALWIEARDLLHAATECWKSFSLLRLER